MSVELDVLATVKQVLVLHLLRQQIEADLAHLRTAPLRLARCYCAWLSHVHAQLLAAIGEHKRQLRRQGVRVIAQQKNSLDFQITYLERGYQIQHCFVLATLQAEAQILLMKLLNHDP